jgi:DNA-directed RNA polymerase specialized sigma24 family protein
MPFEGAEEFRLLEACQEARRASDRTAYDAAFATLYSAHSPTVKAIARHMTRTEEAAQEVAHLAFAELNRNIMIVDPAKGCMGLLRVFLFRRAAEMYARPQPESLDVESTDGQPDLVDHRPTPEGRLLDREQARICLAKAEQIAAMIFGRAAGPPNERITYLFRHGLDYKPQQLAEVQFSGRRLGAEGSNPDDPVSSIEVELEKQWTDRSQLSGERIARLLAPLRRDLRVKLCDYPLHGSTRTFYIGADIWTLPIAEGQLRQYFRSAPAEKDISNWCLNVQKRMAKSAIKEREHRAVKGGAR